MSGKTVALSMITLLFLATALFAVNIDGSDAATTYEVKGLVGEPGDAGINPAVDVKVTITEPDTGKLCGETRTDKDGIFTLSFETDSPSVVFNCLKDGYSIVQLGKSDLYRDAQDRIILDTSLLSPGTNTLVPTDNMDYCILVADTKVSVSVSVMNGATPLRNAKVTLQNNSGKYTGLSNENGICTFSNKVLIGTYQLTIACDGCQEYREEVVITKNTSSIPAQMEIKILPTYGGLTIYHILMIIGVAIGLTLVGVAYVLSSRTWKGLDSNEN